MTTYKDWYISLGAAGLLACNLLFSEVTYKLSSPSIAPGDHALFEIRLKVDPNDKDALPQVYDDLLTQNPKFLLLEKSSHKDGDEWVWRYEITAYKSGQISIPPIQIRRTADTFSTEVTHLEITTVREEQDTELRESFGNISKPIPWNRIIKFLLFGIVVLVLARLAAGWLKKLPWRYWNLRPKKKVRPIPREDDLLWLKRHLIRFRQRLGEEPENDRLVDDLTLILRLYFARRTNLTVEGWTTKEFEKRLSQDQHAQKISSLLIQCDDFKFKDKKTTTSRALATSCLDESERVLLACGT